MWSGTTAIVLPVERNGLRMNSVLFSGAWWTIYNKYRISVFTSELNGV